MKNFARRLLIHYTMGVLLCGALWGCSKGSPNPLHRSSSAAEITAAAEAIRQALKKPLYVHGGGWSGSPSYEEVGFYVDKASSAPRVEVNVNQAREFLLKLKPKIDILVSTEEMDLENRQIIPGRDGYQLDVDQTLIQMQYLARQLSQSGWPHGTAAGPSQPSLALETVATPALKKTGLTSKDISVVMGEYETRYKSTGEDTNRAHNLKLGSDRMNRYILQPGKTVSVNEVVGPRTLLNGFYVAGVISHGEMVEDLGGGMCQISSTLHAAAFFAGLDIVATQPHSRPSVYIPLGMDSTVVYPYVDLRIRNPYDFPVVIHYKTSGNKINVEILGRERPYKVMFGRQILAEAPYTTVIREDPQMPVSQKPIIAEKGYPFYRFTRRRYVYKGSDPITNQHGKIVWAPDTVCFYHSGKEPNWKWVEGSHGTCKEADAWTREYPPTTEIQIVGTGLNPALKKKPIPSSHAITPLEDSERPFFFISR